MSRTITRRRVLTKRIAQECRRMRAGWSAQERERRHMLACRRQRLLQPLVAESASKPR